jgi:hypothetical protein
MATEAGMGGTRAGRAVCSVSETAEVSCAASGFEELGEG